jgi:hypothetical protein
MRKRTFWVLYVTDRMVSVIVGRPCGLQDQDIDQEYPLLVDDEDLIYLEQGQPMPNNVPSPVFIGATVEHAKLTRIVSSILTDFYSVYKDLSESKARGFIERLDQWKRELPPYLDDERPDCDPRVPILRNARITILTAYYHAKILIYRPFLMDSNEGRTEWIETAVSECLNMSKRVFAYSEELVQRGLLIGWFTIYNSINAILVVYVYTIKNMVVSPSQLPPLFLHAEACERLLRENTKDYYLAERFLLVLRELRSEIRQQYMAFDSITSGLDLLVEAPSLAARLPQPEDWNDFDNGLIETLTMQIFDFENGNVGNLY